MGKSFFTKTEADLYDGTLSFATKITATPTAYGLTAAQATTYTTLSNTFRTAYQVANDPVTRTKSTVQAKNDAKRVLKANASMLAKIVEATPTVTNQQRLDLGLFVRATPSPIGPPGQPAGFKASLDGNGDLILTWKCENPANSSGTMYQVYRTIDGETVPEYLGGVGRRTFTDDELPAGSTRVTYQVQAVRSNSVGPWAEFNVNFGKTVSGARTATVTDTSVKIAA
jgi:hypothetical protein